MNNEENKLELLPFLRSKRVRDKSYEFYGKKICWDGINIKCEHDHVYNHCLICRLYFICEHKMLKPRCKICKSSWQYNKSICLHNNDKKKCIKCIELQICVHDRNKNGCRRCRDLYCKHKKERQFCRECGGGGLCEHDKRKSRCVICGGDSVCQHNKIRVRGKVCNMGKHVCMHNKWKRHCKICVEEYREEIKERENRRNEEKMERRLNVEDWLNKDVFSGE